MYSFHKPTRMQARTDNIYSFTHTHTHMHTHIHTRMNAHTYTHRYVDDSTSPILIDPLNEEDYTYSILSKPLVKKPAKPVANPANPVKQATGQCAEAAQARNQNPRQVHKAIVTTTDAPACTDVTSHSSKDGGQGISPKDSLDCKGEKSELNGKDERLSSVTEDHIRAEV